MIVTFTMTATAQYCFLEDSALVLVECESVPDLNGWTVGETVLGGQAITFLHWSGSDYFSTPGKQLLEYKIRIAHPGIYRFLWHCKVGIGNTNTEHNDTWLRIPDASDYYGNKNGHIVHPKGVAVNDPPNGAGADGWFKVYSSGTTDWTWSARTSDNDAHLIYARFDNPGIYTVQLSARSAGHLLNRFILFKESVYSLEAVTQLSLRESTMLQTRK